VVQVKTVLNGHKAEEAAAGLRETTPRGQKARTKVILEIKDGLLYRKGMLWIPEDKELITTILESEHNSKFTAHMGQVKTIELKQRNFWWPKMDERIINYIRSCSECQKNKVVRRHPYGLSLPLELPYATWQSIAMDFITELPLSDKYYQLWLVIEWFTKMAHFIALQKDAKMAADLAVAFAKEVWKYHGLPTDIVSDRDSRFT